MSRSTQAKEFDDACAIQAIGEAINHITLSLLRRKDNTYTSYESAAGSVTEGICYWIADEFKKSKYYG